MRSRWSILSLCLLCGSFQLSAAQESLPPDHSPADLSSVSIHGTIDVVVGTREGFVLATDSRLTIGDTHRDDGQKLFKIGERTVCVIAGLVGADLRAEGFHLTDTIGAHLMDLDRHAQGRIIEASDVAKAVIDGLDSVSGLLEPEAIHPLFDGEVSVVSIGPSGRLEWITLAMPFDIRYVNGQRLLQSLAPIRYKHSTNLGARFDVEALGQPQVVNALLSANRPTDKICGTQAGQPEWCVPTHFTNSAIMRKFYFRKRSGTLDGFTLSEGIELAKTLVKATLDTAPPSWGVGGPIDVLTVTRAGAHWLLKKPQQDFPPPFRKTMTAVTLMDAGEPLDGLQCLLCTFQNMKLSYNGDARVELVRPRFEGTCELTLGKKGEERRPDDVRYLEHLAAGHCEIKHVEVACAAPICIR
jgi:Proteasome subunit